MVRQCNSQGRNNNPVIDTLVFDFWDASACYQLKSYREYPALSNSILNSMRRCPQPCITNLQYTLPDIPCPGRAYPSTLSINYHCDTQWQRPLVIVSTTRATTTATEQTTTTARTTGRQRLTLPAVSLSRRSTTTARMTTVLMRRTSVSTRIRTTQARSQSLSTRPTTTRRTTTDPESTAIAWQTTTGPIFITDTSESKTKGRLMPHS